MISIIDVMRPASIALADELGMLSLDSELCGVTPEDLEAWRSGQRRPTDLELGRIAAATGMPIDRLYRIVRTAEYGPVRTAMTRRTTARRQRQSGLSPESAHRPVECRGVPGVCALCGLPTTARNRRHLL